jgi:hypothetical protein
MMIYLISACRGEARRAKTGPRSGKKQNLSVLRVFVYLVKFIEMTSEADFTGVVSFFFLKPDA